MPDMEEYRMPNCRTDICTYDYKYPGKCYHRDGCVGCELDNGELRHNCFCDKVSNHINNDVNYDCPYFEPLNKEKDND